MNNSHAESSNVRLLIVRVTLFHTSRDTREYDNQNSPPFQNPSGRKLRCCWKNLHWQEVYFSERKWEERERMARGSSHENGSNKAGAFFMATLVMWSVSVFFEIVFNKRTELISVVAGYCFYQLANWVVRNWVSRDPLFVNTCVSLLHSSITSSSGPNLLSLSLCCIYVRMYLHTRTTYIIILYI